MSSSFPDGFRYADEKFSVAVNNMVIGRGSIQERLYDAYMSFHPVTPKDFPEGDLRTKYVSIHKRLTAIEEPADDSYKIGDVKYTLDRMSDDDAQKLAQDIFDLASMIADEVNED